MDVENLDSNKSEKCKGEWEDRREEKRKSWEEYISKLTKLVTKYTYKIYNQSNKSKRDLTCSSISEQSYIYPPFNSKPVYIIALLGLNISV